MRLLDLISTIRASKLATKYQSKKIEKFHNHTHSTMKTIQLIAV